MAEKRQNHILPGPEGIGIDDLNLDPLVVSLVLNVLQRVRYLMVNPN